MPASKPIIVCDNAPTPEPPEMTAADANQARAEQQVSATLICNELMELLDIELQPDDLEHIAAPQLNRLRWLLAHWTTLAEREQTARADRAKQQALNL